MRLTRADVIDDVLGSTPKEKGIDQLSECLSMIDGQGRRVRISIEEICNGEWSIGGKSMATERVASQAQANQGSRVGE